MRCRTKPAAFPALAKLALFVAAMLLLEATGGAQQATPPPAISPQARLTAARAIYIEYAGSRLPYDVISDAFQGWGRYTIVSDPASADLVVSIAAPTSDSGVSVGGAGPDDRRLSPSNSSNVTQIRLTILDARDRAVLWSGNEQPKGSVHERQREENVVQTSLRLFRRFRSTLEPEPAP